MDKPGKTGSSSFLYVYGFALALLLGSIIGICFAAPELRRAILIEDGPVESASAAGYFICAVLLFVYLGKKAAGHWQIAVILIAFGLRELDFNSRFTAMGVAKIKFYLSPDIPFSQKFIAASCALLILYCLVHLLVRNWRSFPVSLKKFEPYAVFTATGLAFLLASLTLDGLGGKLMRIGFVLDNTWREWAENAEEIVELGIPVMFMLGLRYFWAENLYPALDRLRWYARASEKAEAAMPGPGNSWEITGDMQEYRDQADTPKGLKLPGRPR